MSEKPLGFGYQVGAGAIAGVSEVSIRSRPDARRVLTRVFPDLAHVQSNRVPKDVRSRLQIAAGTLSMLSRLECTWLSILVLYYS